MSAIHSEDLSRWAAVRVSASCAAGDVAGLPRRLSVWTVGASHCYCQITKQNYTASVIRIFATLVARSRSLEQCDIGELNFNSRSRSNLAVVASNELQIDCQPEQI